MSRLAVGKAKYGYEKRKYFKLKDGEATFRILPPLGDLAESGKWSMYYNVHYGYKNSEGKMRTFQSPLVVNRKTKMVEHADAAKERIEKLKAQFEAAKKAGHKEAIETLEKLVGRKGQFNLDSHHYMNVIDEQGNIGILKIRHKCKQVLDAEIKRLREAEGVDPLSVDNGRFFVFGRSGMGLETTFTVRTKTEKIKVDGVGTVNRDIVHVLSDDVLDRLSSEAGELDKLFKRPTSEEVARIVNEGSKAVDEILNNRDSSDGSDDPAADFEDESNSSYSAPAPEAPKSAPAPVAPSYTAPEAQTVVSTLPPKIVQPAAPRKTTAQSLSEMSVEDFLKTLEA